MFFSGLFQRKSDAPVTTPAELADAIGLSYDTYTGKQISSQRAMRLTAVFSCVRVLAESVGMLPCNLYHLNGSLKQRATGERLHKLISTHPNGYMTPQEFWELVVTCLCLRGNFYAYKVKAFGEVAELLPVDPGCVVPKLNSSWEPVYQVTFPDGSTDVLSQEDIWHVRTLTLDGLVGLNPIAYAREAISLAAATEEHGARLFSNGAVTSGVLRTEQTLSDQAYERLKKDFEERHTGLGNAHRPMILEMGLDWKSMALNAEDSQFLETRKFQLEEICRLFRVPLHMVQNTDRATFNNIEELGLGFINYSLVPYLTRIEQRINTGLVRKSKQGVFYAKFNAGALLRGDMKSRFEAYATGINWGIYSPNDCRDLEDMNPRPGGDVYLTPMNMTTKPPMAVKPVSRRITPMQTKQRLDVPLSLKSVSDSGEFEGYGSVFGVKDSHDDVVMSGAFAASLREWSDRKALPALLWQHRMDEPIGVYTEMKEDDVGLYVKGRLLIDDDPLAKRAHAHMKAGSLTGLSIGYVLKDWEYDRSKEAFLLKEIDLWEVSLVTFPSNDEARISDVKNALARGEIPEQKKIERVLRDVGLSRTQAKAFMAGGYGALSLRDAEDVGSALNVLKNLNF